MLIDELIEGCVNNDRTAQKEFYLLTCDRLLNVCRRYTADIHEAKDTLQNVYIAVYKNLKSFDKKRGNLDSWLTKIAVNASLQILRKKKRQDEVLQKALKQNLEEINPSVLSRLYKEDLVKVVQELPDGFRAIFNLHEMEGYSHKEIASIMGITESTSRSQLTRAKKLLRQLIIERNNLDLC